MRRLLLLLLLEKSAAESSDCVHKIAVLERMLEAQSARIAKLEAAFSTNEEQHGSRRRLAGVQPAGTSAQNARLQIGDHEALGTSESLHFAIGSTYKAALTSTGLTVDGSLEADAVSSGSAVTSGSVAAGTSLSVGADANVTGSITAGTSLSVGSSLSVAASATVADTVTAQGFYGHAETNKVDGGGENVIVITKVTAADVGVYQVTLSANKNVCGSGRYKSFVHGIMAIDGQWNSAASAVSYGLTWRQLLQPGAAHSPGDLTYLVAWADSTGTNARAETAIHSAHGSEEVEIRTVHGSDVLRFTVQNIHWGSCSHPLGSPAPFVQVRLVKLSDGPSWS